MAAPDTPDARSVTDSREATSTRPSTPDDTQLSDADGVSTNVSSVAMDGGVLDSGLLGRGRPEFFGIFAILVRAPEYGKFQFRWGRFRRRCDAASKDGRRIRFRVSRAEIPSADGRLHVPPVPQSFDRRRTGAGSFSARVPFAHELRNQAQSSRPGSIASRLTSP